MPLPPTEAFMTVEYEINESLSPSDQLYCTCVNTTPQTGNVNFAATGSPVLFGIVTGIRPGAGDNNIIDFHFTTVGNSVTPLNIPCTGNQFISFAKSASTNKASLKGYFNLVTFINDDNNNEAELFMVNSETTFSSK